MPAARPVPASDKELRMIRKIVTALILIPIAVGFAALAVANRQSVTISLDPFDQTAPAVSVAIPLFALVLALLILGVAVGGIAAWMRQSKWRRKARMAEAQARDLRAEVDRLKRRIGPAELVTEPLPVGFRPQLTIRPPAA
jgi:hypothetical protein